MGIMLVLIGFVWFCFGLKYVISSVKEAKKEKGHSQWPDNFLNYSILSAGLMVILSGIGLLANVDLRTLGVFQGFAILAGIGFFAFFVTYCIIRVVSAIKTIINENLQNRVDTMFKETREWEERRAAEREIELIAQERLRQQSSQAENLRLVDEALYFYRSEKSEPYLIGSEKEAFDARYAKFEADFEKLSMEDQTWIIDLLKPQMAKIDSSVNAPVPDPIVPIEGDVVPDFMRVPTRKGPVSTRKQPTKKPATKKSSTLSTK